MTSHGKKDDRGTKIRSVVIVPSTCVTNTEDAEEIEGVEKTEIAVQLSVRQDGGWGWIVLIASFTTIFIVDGVVFTFGALLKDIGKELKMHDSAVAVINSIQTSTYFFMSPVASGMINKFGFRACSMTGSMIYSFSLLISYFSISYPALLVFFGFFSGSGGSLCNMASNLIVGFYFTKLRSLVILIASCGSSMGITTMYPINALLVASGGWRTTILFHAGLIACLYFCALTYRPILSVTVTQTDDATTDPTQTVTYLPSVMGGISGRGGRGEQVDIRSTHAERLFKAVSNVNFPTAAAVLNEGNPTVNRPGTSKISKLTLQPLTSQPGISSQQQKQINSMVSKRVSIVEPKDILAVRKKKRCWKKCCQWDDHVNESRPMYRDDVFYPGKVEDLDVYKKSVILVPEAERTGLEYDLAVTRTVAAKDLSENRGLFTIAIRRVLASMLDISIMKRPSYIAIVLSTFFVHLGWLVPYIYIADKNKSVGIPSRHADMFVSVIGFTNMLSKLLYGVLASKFNAIILLFSSLMVAGGLTMLSDIIPGIYYQYFYCVAFGMFSAAVALRPIILVDIYGLDKLTNAMGMLYIAAGVAVLISAPLAALVKERFGYRVSFIVAGVFFIGGGICLVPIHKLREKELRGPQQSEEKPNIQTINTDEKVPSAPFIKQ